MTLTVTRRNAVQEPLDASNVFTVGRTLQNRTEITEGPRTLGVASSTNDIMSVSDEPLGRIAQPRREPFPAVGRSPCPTTTIRSGTPSPTGGSASA